MSGAMRMRCRAALVASALASVCVVVAPHAASAATAAAPAADVQGAADVLARYAPAIVRVEAVLETRLNLGGQGEAEDSRLDVLGAVVSPDGLVMIWNSHISSARMTEMMEAAGRTEGMGIQVVPRSFTVMLPEGEVPALLAATDSALDLAFLQLERPPAQPLPFVDFTHAAKPAVGDALLAVSRLGRGFESAADDPESAHVAVVSDGFFRSHFGGEASAASLRNSLRGRVGVILKLFPSSA